MNITVDKNKTVAVLVKARGRLFGKDRDVISGLIIQIVTHGGKLYN